MIPRMVTIQLIPFSVILAVSLKMTVYVPCRFIGENALYKVITYSSCLCWSLCTIL